MMELSSLQVDVNLWSEHLRITEHLNGQKTQAVGSQNQLRH